MHWSEKIAKDIIKRSPDKEEYVCAAGISPSGSIHIGNFRDIATSYFVYKALIKQGKKARLLFSWDEFDRFRKVPVNVKEVAPELENEIGKPYVDVKDPYGCCSSYAEHFEKEFEASLSRFGVKVDFRRQSENYRSGKYAKYIIQAVQKRREIFDILDKFRQLVDLRGDLRYYGCFGSGCDRAVKGEESGVASHYLDEEQAFVRGGGVAYFVDTLHDGVKCGVVANGGVGAVKVIVDGAGQTDDRYLEFMAEYAGSRKRTVTADHYE